MAVWSIILITLHAVPGVFWAGSTFAIARSPLTLSDRVLGRAQAGAAGITILAGVILWGINHAHAPGPKEWILTVGVFCAVAAVVIQHAIAWPAYGRLSKQADIPFAEAAADRKSVVAGQRVSAALLVVTVIAMVSWRYV